MSSSDSPSPAAVSWYVACTAIFRQNEGSKSASTSRWKRTNLLFIHLFFFVGQLSQDSLHMWMETRLLMKPPSPPSTLMSFSCSPEPRPTTPAATLIPLLFTARLGPYRDPRSPIQPCLLAQSTCRRASLLPLPGPPWDSRRGGGTDSSQQNVAPCSNDIVNPNECYSNWLMGNSQPVLRGDTSRQSHLPSGQVCVVSFFFFF